MHKYHARKARCLQGHMHDSTKEAQRCSVLHAMQQGGEISNLQIQVKFELIPAKKYRDMPDERSCSYIADFVYMQDGKRIIEDVKGMRTPEYIMKRKLMKRIHCDEHTVFREVK